LIFFKDLLSPPPHIRAAAAVAAAVALLSAAAHPAEIRNSLTVGFDSFIDRYTILEDDTLEAIQEYEVGMRNSFSFKGKKTKGGLLNLFSYGNQTVDEMLEGNLFYGPSRSTRIDLRSSFHFKHFQEGGDYTYGNDYVQANTYLKVRNEIDEDLQLNVKSRFELIGFDEATQFDHDYRYADAGLEIERGSYSENALRAGAALGFKETPDTTALSYRRTIMNLEFQSASTGKVFFHFYSIGDRRDYREKIRSSYWNITTYSDLTLFFKSGKSLSLRAESELLFYDNPTSTYFDNHFMRFGIKGDWPVSTTTSISAEPRYARLLCSEFTEERYQELSVILGIDILDYRRILLACSYEPGYRDYLAGTNDIYSDFYINRVSVLGSLTIRDDLVLDLFFMHDPERHTRRDDDFSITLVSISLIKTF